MKTVRGINLADLEGPIRDGLTRYSEIAEGTVEFDVDSACKLDLTPEKPNSARSATIVRYLGESVTTLYVIAFAPEDGTGDESSYNLAETNTGKYPRTTRVMPRSKATTASEAHLTLLTQPLESPYVDPVLFAGSLDLILGGFRKLEKLAELGQDSDTYSWALHGEIEATPTSTLTVGYSGAIDHAGDPNMWNYWRKRFGDPHAVFNPSEELQVCGFIGIPSENAQLADLDLFRAIKTVEPLRS